MWRLEERGPSRAWRREEAKAARGGVRTGGGRRRGRVGGGEVSRGFRKMRAEEELAIAISEELEEGSKREEGDKVWLGCNY